MPLYERAYIFHKFYIKKEARAESANRTATTMVALKIIFSPPLLVLCPELPSLPPKALPRLPSDCCISIRAIRRIERIICMIGRIDSIRDDYIGIWEDFQVE
jgi:hypothetical protein